MKIIAIILALLTVLLSVAPAQTSEPSVRFATVDVSVDPKGQPLAAYQLEFVADAQRVKLVGVEGGDHAAYREPPYYDPAALSRHRVILAAFSTSSDLPRSATRVARLHLQITGNEKPAWEAKLMVAADAGAQKIPAATVSLSEGVEP